jgi:hypothetical protein
VRFRFVPTAAERAALRARLARLQQPAAALAALDSCSCLPDDFKRARATCTVARVHSDRFVLRVTVRAATGETRSYALKVYADDFARRVWTHAQALAAHHPPNGNGVCLPIRYLSRERMLVFPWVEGDFLSKIVDDRKPLLLRRAAALAAALHRTTVVPEHVTSTRVFVHEAAARSERLRRRWPETAPVIEPLMDALREASVRLEPAVAAPVHGDLAAGQFIWTGDCLVLLDLDMFGYADPAYDVGHFMAQLERRCVSDDTLPLHAHHWLACFRNAYLAACPEVSPRNITFYRGLTLTRKVYTVYRRKPEEWQALAHRLAARALAAFEEAAGSVYVS